jgi:hypothetical protein
MRRKRAWQSKINWLGLLTCLLGMTMDPDFQRYLGEWVSSEWSGKLVSISGMLVVVLRTWATSIPIGKDKPE